MKYLLCFFFSALITLAVKKLNISCLPSNRCSHSRPVPTCGGLSVAVVFLSYLLLSENFSHIFAYVIASLVLIVISLLDDISPISHKIRIVVHLASAAIMVYGGFLVKLPGPEWLSLIFSILAIVSIINGANFIDGLDGLLCGCVLTSLLFAFSMFFDSKILVLASCILGFFIFNFPKASVFLGDVGSTFLGLTLCFLATNSNSSPANATFYLFPLAFVGFDVAFTLLHRLFRGCAVTTAHREHLIHILNDSGKSHVFVTGTYMAATALAGCLVTMVFYEYIRFLTALLIYIVSQFGLLAYIHSKNRPACN